MPNATLFVSKNGRWGYIVTSTGICGFLCGSKSGLLHSVELATRDLGIKVRERKLLISLIDQSKFPDNLEDVDPGVRSAIHELNKQQIAKRKLVRGKWSEHLVERTISSHSTKLQ